MSGIDGLHLAHISDLVNIARSIDGGLVSIGMGAYGADGITLASAAL